MHALKAHGLKQTWPSGLRGSGLHTSTAGSHPTQARPASPHAATAVPGWQAPSPSQQPAHVEGPQAVGACTDGAVAGRSAGKGSSPVRLPQAAASATRVNGAVRFNGQTVPEPASTWPLEEPDEEPDDPEELPDEEPEEPDGPSESLDPPHGEISRD